MGQARKAAMAREHAAIAPEHVLLGLIDTPGSATTVLERIGVDLARVRTSVDALTPEQPGATLAAVNRLVRRARGGAMPFSPGAKAVLERSLRDASGLGHDFVGTEHLLLGFWADRESIAALALDLEGVRYENVREQIVDLARRRPG